MTRRKKYVFMPKAEIGETVEVLNYRMKPPQWEMGRVVCVQFKQRWQAGVFSGSYEVWIERPGTSSYRVTVGEEGVR